MKHLYKHILPLFILCAFFFGCSTRPNELKRVQYAYSLLNSNPDSSLVVLSQCNRSTFSEQHLAYYNLVYYMAQDKSGLDVNSDSLLRLSYNYYTLHADDSLYAKCFYYMGKYYSLVDSAKLAKDCFLTAIDSSEKQGDLYTQYLSSEKLSRLLRISNPDEALLLTRNAYRLLCQYDSTKLSNKVYLLINIGNCHNQLHNPDSSKVYMKQALKEALSSKNDQLIGDAYHSVSSSFLRDNQVDSALSYAHKALETVPRKPSSLYSLLSECYMAANLLDSAKSVLVESLGHAATSKDKYVAFVKLAEIGLEQNGDSETKHYVDSSLVYLRQLYLTSEKENVEYMKDKVALNRKEELLMEKQWVFGIALTALLTIFILLTSLFYTQRRMSRKQILLEQERNKIEKLKHDVEQEKINLIIENRERQIELYKKLILSRIDFSNKINELKDKKTEETLSNTDWLEIEAYLNELVPGFLPTLRERHPDLKEKDIRFCMLLKLGFKNNDLLRFYERGLQAIKQRLLNLKPTLGIEGKSISTREYICNIL